MGKPWHRRDTETSKQYRAFECYYMLDPAVRSLKKACEVYRKEAQGQEEKDINSRFGYWSAQHDWVARAEAWDEYVAKEREKAYIKGIAKQSEKKGVNLEQMREVLADRFDELGEAGDDLLKEILEKRKDEVKLSEVNGLLRTRLDIFRALSGEKKHEAPDPFAGLDEAVAEWSK